MSNNYNFAYNKQIPIPTQGLDLREMLSKHAAGLLWGNGIVFMSENKKIQKIIDDFNKINDIQSFLYSNEKQLSAYGIIIGIIQLTENGRPMLETAFNFGRMELKEYLNNGVEGSFTIKDRYNGFFTDYIAKNGTITVTNRELDKANNTIVKDMLKNKWTYKKYIPFLEIMNLPNKNFFQNIQFGDYYPDAVAVTSLQLLINSATKAINHELNINQTKFFGSINQQYIDNIKNTESGEVSLMYSKAFIKSSTANNNDTITILQANPQLNTYMDFYDRIIGKYWEGSGYSYVDQYQTDSTAFETNMNQSRDLLTTRLKRNLRQIQYRKLFKIMFYTVLEQTEKKMSEEEMETLSEDFIFTIKENNIINIINEIEKVTKLIGLDLMDRETAYKDLFNVDDEEAAARVKEIMENNSAKAESDMKLYGNKENGDNEDPLKNSMDNETNGVDAINENSKDQN